MNKGFLIFILIFFGLMAFPDAFATYGVTIIQTDGFSLTSELGVLGARDIAKQQALKSAVTMAIQRVTDESIRHLKAHNIWDKILNHPEFYVISSELISERVTEGELRVSMEIQLNLDKIADDIALLPADSNAVFSDMPMIAVFAFFRNPDKPGGEAFPAIEKPLNDAMDLLGFAPISDEKFRLIQKTSHYLKALDGGEADSLIGITGLQGAKYVMIVDLSRNQKVSVKGCSLDIRFRLFDASAHNKMVMDYSDSTPARGSCDLAAREAAEERFGLLADQFKAQGIISPNTRVKITLIIRGFGSQLEAISFSKSFSQIPQVISSNRTSYAEGGTACFEIISDMSSDKLIAYLVQTPFDDVRLENIGRFGKAFLLEAKHSPIIKEEAQKQ